MTKDVWKVHVETDQEEVARLVGHYNIWPSQSWMSKISWSGW